jgi:hypothetical protein
MPQDVPDSPLNVETRVRTPLGLQTRTRRSAPSCCGGWLVNHGSKPEYPENIRSQVVRSGSQQRHTAEGWIHRRPG